MQDLVSDPNTLTYLVRFSAGFYIPLLLWWRYIDRRLAQILITGALPLAVLAFVVGRLVKQRIFIEIVPLIWLASLQVVSARRRAMHLPRTPDYARAHVATAGDFSE